VRETAEILEVAQQRADDLSVWSARFLHGVREAVTQERSLAAFLPLIDIEFAKEKARHGNIDGAVGVLEAILQQDDLPLGGLGPHGRAAEVLVELLLQRGGPVDVAARDAIDWLAAMPTEPGVVIYEIALLRLRALLARACGDELGYRQYVDRYRTMANELGFDGHIAMAEAMT
jgi:adenylate cyclase